MFKHAQVTPKVKAVTDYKAALAVQRPFLKPVGEMSYSYTPQTHFCILFSNLKQQQKKKRQKNKKSSTFACKGGQRPISQCLDKQNVSGFHLTQAKELPAQALELSNGTRELRFWKESPFSLSATYLCTALKKKKKKAHPPPKLLLREEIKF